MSTIADPSAAEANGVSAATAALGSLFGLPPDVDTVTPPSEAELAPGSPATSAEAAPAPETAPPAETPPQEQQGSLAELIRQQRQDRALRQAKEREATDVRAKLAEAEDRLSKLSKADLVADPIGFAQAHGLSEQDMALIGQAYLYHLVPDKAPPDLRYKLLEAKTARESKQREAERQKQAQEAARLEAAQRIEAYAGVVSTSVQTWESAASAHPFPESKAWFGGNHEEYTQSLMHTANNIAESAAARGEVADLTPKAVAAALERDLASRAQRLRSNGGKPNQQVSATPVAPAAGSKPAVLSTRGQGASPAPKATSEEERIKRAMDVVFATR